ncbi:hypothetical protein MBLNU457_7340t1 [Dothideomycetes sp. NU457]
MARKSGRAAVKEDSSDLSPPPELIDAPPNGTPVGSKKRKRTTAITANGESTKNKTSSTAVTGTSNSETKAPGRSKVAKNTVVKKEVPETNEIAPDVGTETPSKKTRKRKAVEYKEEDQAEEGAPPTSAEKPKGRKKAKLEKTEDIEDQVDGDESKPTKRKRKTKEEKEAEAMPLAARTVGHKMFIGAHVSSAGGVHNAVMNSVHIGANAFALFLKSQRKWANPPLADDHCTNWHTNCNDQSYDAKQHIVPHGSYLVNLAHTDAARTKQAYDAFVDDLKRCERLGIHLYNFHPGNVAGKARPEAIAHLAGNLNKAHRETTNVVTLLENMAAGGNVIGSTFEDLRDIIELVDDKSRVGICLDTCHAFAGGYDLRTQQALKDTLQHLDDLVGIKYLRALHLNDSKAPFKSHRDLHANIGTGFLGLRAFHAIMNEPRFEGLPMVLETPIEVRDEDGNVVLDEKGKEKEDKGIWAREIKMLESFVGMDIDSKEFLELEIALAKKGAPERARVQDQVKRREEKAKAKSQGGKKGAKKRKGDNEELSEGSELSDLSDEEA